MTAAPASSVITCLAPTSAPALMVTERLGPNVWVSRGNSLCSPCCVLLAFTLAPDPHSNPPPGFTQVHCHQTQDVWCTCESWLAGPSLRPQTD